VGTFSVSGGYMLREARLVPRKSSYPEIAARQNHFYAQISAESYGWEWAGRLGAADFSDGDRFNAGYLPFAGVGVKGNLYGDRMSEFGLVASLRGDVYSRYKVDGVFVSPGLEGNVRIKDYWDVEAGLMAHRRIGGVTVYGGPVLDYVEAKIYRTTSVPVGIEMTEKTYYKHKGLPGLAGGISWRRGGLQLGLEAGLSDGGYSVGVETGVGF
jgi:hypothetical protein